MEKAGPPWPCPFISAGKNEPITPFHDARNRSDRFWRFSHHPVSFPGNHEKKEPIIRQTYLNSVGNRALNHSCHPPFNM